MVYQVAGVQLLDQVAGAQVVVNQVAGTRVLDQVAGVHVVVDYIIKRPELMWWIK